MALVERDGDAGEVLTLGEKDAVRAGLPDGEGVQAFRRVLVPGGRLALNVFGPIERNPATCALAAALDRHVGPGASVAKRTEHALADTAELRALVAAAPFTDIEIRTATKMVRFSSAADYVRIQLAATPLANLITSYNDARRNSLTDALAQDVGADLAAYAGDDSGLTFPQEVQVVLARS
jgi:hypothetical protein